MAIFGGLVRNLYGRFANEEKQPERRTSGGGQSGSKAFSDRNPTPKNFFGPLTGLGKAAISTGMSVFGKFNEGGRQTSGDVQAISGKLQEAIGKGFISQDCFCYLGSFVLSYFFVCVFLGSHRQHMEVPRLGVE